MRFLECSTRFTRASSQLPSVTHQLQEGCVPFVLCIIILTIIIMIFRLAPCFLRFDRMLLLKTAIIAWKPRCPAVASRTDGLWRNQLCLEGGKAASLEEGGKYFRRNRVCFILKYRAHQYGESDEAVILLSAGVGAAGVTAQPFPFPSPAPWGGWQDFSPQEPEFHRPLLKDYSPPSQGCWGCLGSPRHGSSCSDQGWELKHWLTCCWLPVLLHVLTSPVGAHDSCWRCFLAANKHF